MPDINQYAPASGRKIKEDGSLVNLADKIESIYKALVVDKNAGVNLSGSNVPIAQAIPVIRPSKISMDTVINAQSLVAGANTGAVSLNHQGETFTFIVVTIDKQPWKLEANNPFIGITGVHPTFPKLNNEATAYPVLTLPKIALYTGLTGWSNSFGDPTTLKEAMDIAVAAYNVGSGKSVDIRVTNMHATDIATITVRILRVWR
jgi:hypothetical protein